MAKATERDPFKHLLVVCTALLAVLLNAFVLLIGGSAMTLAMATHPQSGKGETVAVAAIALGFIGVGLTNVLIMAHVFWQKDRANPHAFKVANVLNGLLIALVAYAAFVGEGPIDLMLLAVTPATTLIAIHVGRKKPILAGHCQTCGYDLAGLKGGICPECGAAITHAVPDAAD